MIAVVWQFDVKAGREREFEEFMGANGEWTNVSRHSRSYLGSSFLRDQNRAARYLVIEYWSELVVSEQPRTFRSEEMQALDRRRNDMAESVEPLGIFTALDVPERSGPAWSQRSGSGASTRKRPKAPPVR